jgi:hypothetical protein
LVLQGCTSNFIEVILRALKSQSNSSEETEFEGLPFREWPQGRTNKHRENRNIGLSKSGYDYINWEELNEIYVQ